MAQKPNKNSNGNIFDPEERDNSSENLLEEPFKVDHQEHQGIKMMKTISALTRKSN